MTLLEVDELSIQYETGEGPVNAVNGVTFSVDSGERFGLVGESGCGKTTIAKAILGLLPDNATVTGGRILYDGVDLISADGSTLRDIRWNDIALVSQTAMNALDPVYTVGNQIMEAIQIHRDASNEEARRRTIELLEKVGIGRERFSSYPHQLSGGMRQRVMIAMALSLNPPIILADEPTTALDVIMQDHILHQIDELTDELENSLLMITHDISVISETCENIAVMYGGQVVERGPVTNVFTSPEHPYTLGLLEAFPSLEDDASELTTMLGTPPDLKDLPTGCFFYERCPYREDQCKTGDPPLSERGSDRSARCFVTEDGTDLMENMDVIGESQLWQKL